MKRIGRKVDEMIIVYPLIGVDDIKFGMCVNEIEGLGYLEDMAGVDDITNWRTFQKEDGKKCYVRNDAVVCVYCFGDALVDDFQLIGRKSEDFNKKFGAPDEVGDLVCVYDDTYQTPYEYYSLGLQVWFENDVSVAVFCNEEYADEL
ncbi:hypothetical protein [Leeia aquatica]|uniref:Uncharacterized protein n=1 Tax=Leeia aquatica TaxID=2725557 RepID=A0A847SEC4_9NEIS|nr:hypothetical protein [Leeia aquatica]NLR75796.1 hypothetical protein [Leeia aquatica]